jgi:hypothetical protein
MLRLLTWSARLRLIDFIARGKLAFYGSTKSQALGHF